MNNYHTQLDGNMLNKIAQENKLMAGTPIPQSFREDKNFREDKREESQLELSEDVDQPSLPEQHIAPSTQRIPQQVPQQVPHQAPQQAPPPQQTYVAQKSKKDAVTKKSKKGKTAKKTKKKSKKSQKKMMPDIITAIALMIIFIILVHPKTSGMLSKYMGSLDSLKGMALRSLVIGLGYIVLTKLTALLIK